MGRHTYPFFKVELETPSIVRIDGDHVEVKEFYFRERATLEGAETFASGIAARLQSTIHSVTEITEEHIPEEGFFFSNTFRERTRGHRTCAGMIT